MLQGVFLLGEGATRADATSLIQQYQSNARVDEALAEVKQYWLANGQRRADRNAMPRDRPDG